MLSTTGYATPWQGEDRGNLAQIVPSEIWGEDFAENLPLSREAAIAIPAVSKGRNRLVTSISRFPLVALKGDAVLDTQPAFLQRTKGTISPYERMAWTVDDCIFFGYSLWLVERGADRGILDAAWCPMRDWTITNGHILVNEHPVDESEVILFNPPFEGLLNVGARTLRGARDTELAWTARMQSPPYVTELDVTDDTQLSQDEVNEWEKAWIAKHKAGKPSVGVTPPGMSIRTHEGSLGESDLFIESRNAVRTDVGSFLNISTSMMDGTLSEASLTYTTKEGERNSFYEFDLPFWTDPIEARLSQDDVVPHGQRVRFDKYENYALTPTPTGAPTED